MTDLVFLSYKQPYAGNSFRFGSLCSIRDTEKHPPSLFSPYRRRDLNFRRRGDLWTLETAEGVRSFYRDRVNWAIRIPFLGFIAKIFNRVDAVVSAR